jgi:ribosomal protein S26
MRVQKRSQEVCSGCACGTKVAKLRSKKRRRREASRDEEALDETGGAGDARVYAARVE